MSGKRWGRRAQRSKLFVDLHHFCCNRSMAVGCLALSVMIVSWVLTSQVTHHLEKEQLFSRRYRVQPAPLAGRGPQTGSIAPPETGKQEQVQSGEVSGEKPAVFPKVLE